MTIVRREHRAHFTIVPNAVFTDERLSVEAKGVLGFLLSRPHKWRVRLDHIGRTLLVGRKKLQRIFRELISAGYVTREQQRLADGQRFGEIDYVVRDVPVPANVAGPPRGRKGPAAPRVQKGPAYKEAPRGPNGPAYKEIDKNRSLSSPGHVPRASRRHLEAKPVEAAHDDDDAARLDLRIVELFPDRGEGWAFLIALSAEDRGVLRDRQRRGELNRTAVDELRKRYRARLDDGPIKPTTKGQ
ncbi:helix-turn-helix domain-containing protein [Bradyrhizobium sp. SZCCHNS3051]|uniref:helix-turn-helix domain-containing protein n=1 Tax=Bradyrhizobium sp. SZCCHNS3051 TaxID=3057320 RepID=UPI002916FB06|nr:helix-turn-helix domain-containing protein [Bradyrhizobium sp. SZCCHNS3051]